MAELAIALTSNTVRQHWHFYSGGTQF